MIRWKLSLCPCLWRAWLTAREYGTKARRTWNSLQLPYFMPHVWQAMLLGLFGVSGAIGAAGALYLMRLRGLW